MVTDGAEPRRTYMHLARNSSLSVGCVASAWVSQGRSPHHPKRREFYVIGRGHVDIRSHFEIVSSMTLLC